MAKEIKIRIDADESQLILDLPNFKLIPPSTGIYDEPVRYYKANLQWAKLLEGFVGHLLKYQAWKEAENENYIGVQEIAEWLVGVEVPFVFPEESGCDNFLPSAAFVNYYPQNPYNQPDYIPPDYLVPPFFVNDEFEYPELMGYLATDVFVNPASFTIDPIDLITLNLPRIEIQIRGTGQIEVDFLSVEAGSVCICKIGSMPNIGDIIGGGAPEDGVRIVDLNRDTISIPPEHDFIVAEEFNIEAEADELTTIYCVFMPVINDSLIPLAFGGGIRQIGLCAAEGMEGGGSVEAVRFNETTCSFEQRINGTWEVIEGNEFIAECFGGDMATKEDIKQALIEWTQDTALKIALGEITPFSVDEEGEVVVGGDAAGEGGLPEDDPATPLIDENLAAKAGGVIKVVDFLQEILNRMFTWYSTNPNPNDQQAAERLTLIYGLDPVKAAAFTSYWYNTYINSQGQVTLNETTLNGLMYCHGHTLKTFAEYVFESHATAAEQPVLVEFIQALDQALLDGWYADGIGVPSTEYVIYPCTKAPIEEFSLDMSLANFPQYTTNNVYKAGHRLLIEVSGSFVDSDVPNTIQDFFYSVNTSTGAKTYLPAQFQISSGGISEPSQAQVPYQPSHSYAVTLDTSPTVGASSIIFGRDNDTFTIPNVTGILTFKITDLGEYAL